MTKKEVLLYVLETCNNHTKSENLWHALIQMTGYRLYLSVDCVLRQAICTTV